MHFLIPKYETGTQITILQIRHPIPKEAPILEISMVPVKFTPKFTISIADIPLHLADVNWMANWTVVGDESGQSGREPS